MEKYTEMTVNPITKERFDFVDEKGKPVVATLNLFDYTNLEQTIDTSGYDRASFFVLENTINLVAGIKKTSQEPILCRHLSAFTGDIKLVDTTIRKPDFFQHEYNLLFIPYNLVFVRECIMDRPVKKQNDEILMSEIRNWLDDYSFNQYFPNIPKVKVEDYDLLGRRSQYKSILAGRLIDAVRDIERGDLRNTPEDVAKRDICIYGRSEEGPTKPVKFKLIGIEPADRENLYHISKGNMYYINNESGVPLGMINDVLEGYLEKEYDEKASSVTKIVGSLYRLGNKNM